MELKCNLRRNLYTLREHVTISFSLLLYVIVDQVNNKILELMSHNHGPDVLFSIWWGLHLLEKIVYFIVKNLYVIYSAHKNYPEFSGYIERKSSDQPKPRPINFVLSRGMCTEYKQNFG